MTWQVFFKKCRHKRSRICAWWVLERPLLWSAVWFNALHVKANFHVEMKMVDQCGCDTWEVPENNGLCQSRQHLTVRVHFGFKVCHQVAPRVWCLWLQVISTWWNPPLYVLWFFKFFDVYKDHTTRRLPRFKGGLKSKAATWIPWELRGLAAIRLE